MWKLYYFNAFLMQKQYSYQFYEKHEKKICVLSLAKFEMWNITIQINQPKTSLILYKTHAQGLPYKLSPNALHNKVDTYQENFKNNGKNISPLTTLSKKMYAQYKIYPHGISIPSYSILLDIHISKYHHHPQLNNHTHNGYNNCQILQELLMKMPDLSLINIQENASTKLFLNTNNYTKPTQKYQQESF